MFEALEKDKSKQPQDAREFAHNVRELAWVLGSIPTANADQDLVALHHKLIGLLIEAAQLSEDIPRANDVGKALGKGAVTVLADISLLGGVPVTSGVLFWMNLSAHGIWSAAGSCFRGRFRNWKSNLVICC